MILFIDDEATRSLRWREAIEHYELRYLRSAAEALAAFQDASLMSEVRLVVLDLSMYTTGGLSDAETGYGRLTGMVLRQRLRDSGWKGPIVVLSNSRDDVVRQEIESSGDLFLRKPEVLPPRLREVVDHALAG